MWRCIIAIAHADGKIHEEERSYLEKVFNGMQRARGLTPEQRAILEGDIETQRDPEEFLKQITDPSYRGQIMHFALYLAKCDGVIDITERQLIDKLHLSVTQGRVTEEIKEQARDAVKIEASAHHTQVEENRPQEGLTAFMDDMLLKMGVDVMDEN